MCRFPRQESEHLLAERDHIHQLDRCLTRRGWRTSSASYTTRTSRGGHSVGWETPVLLSGLFILDLLVIHPFEDGNGQVARLLTGALPGEHGYTVGRYVSLERRSLSRLTPTTRRCDAGPCLVGMFN